MMLYEEKMCEMGEAIRAAVFSWYLSTHKLPESFAEFSSHLVAACYKYSYRILSKMYRRAGARTWDANLKSEEIST